MRYIFQEGAVVQPSDFDLSIDADISYAGLWYSLNDHRHYRLMADAFGQYDQTHTRKTVKSNFYAGDYTVRAVKDSTKRTWKVLVNGVDQSDLEQAAQNLIDWFSQDYYNVREKQNEVVTTMLCEKADYNVDASHVYAHNCKRLVSLNFSVNPTVSREIVL